MRRIAARDDSPRCPVCTVPMDRMQTPTMLISSFAPYRAVARDKESGKLPLIRSRDEHRAFLARNGYEEVGTDRSMAPASPEEARQSTLAQQDRDERTYNFNENTHEAT